MSKRVYVSSTFIDLVAYRAKVLERLRRSKSIVVAMEDYAAFDERPTDKCLADVKGCDIYVGILAKRYGYVPGDNNPNSLSITEMEYRQACDAECTRLIFQLDPDAPWLDKFNDRLTGEGDGGAKIQRFRAEVGEKHGIRLFRDPEELAGMVLEAIVAEISQGSPAPGDTENGGLHLAAVTTRYWGQGLAMMSLRVPVEYILQLSGDPLYGKAGYPGCLAGTRALPPSGGITARAHLPCRFQDQVACLHRSRRAVRTSAGYR